MSQYGSDSLVGLFVGFFVYLYFLFKLAPYIEISVLLYKGIYAQSNLFLCLTMGTTKTNYH